MTIFYSDFTKGFANRVTIEISKYYAEYSIVTTSFKPSSPSKQFFWKKALRKLAGQLVVMIKNILKFEIKNFF